MLWLYLWILFYLSGFQILLMGYLSRKSEYISRKNIFGFITHHKYNYCLTILWRAANEMQVFKHAVPIDLTRYSVLGIYIFKGFYSPGDNKTPHNGKYVCWETWNDWLIFSPKILKWNFLQYFLTYYFIFRVKNKIELHWQRPPLTKTSP